MIYFIAMPVVLRATEKKYLQKAKAVSLRDLIIFLKGPNRPGLGAESSNTEAELTRHEGPSWLKEDRGRIGERPS